MNATTDRDEYVVTAYAEDDGVSVEVHLPNRRGEFRRTVAADD